MECCNPAGPYTFAPADMDQVISLADQVECSLGLSISNNYWDNFIPDNAATSKELIFTIPNKRGAGVSGSVRSRYFCTLHYNAEALLRKGNAGGALTIVNELRAKRGAAALDSLDEKALLDERGRELYWEGWRRNDQIRFGTFTGSWEFKNASVDGHEVLYPIPATALASNPNLKQNAGY
ncbi:MAG: RagB/SusD family nutrient uptake outer membrane protein [Saprospiraceae bacterium]|nr:RagB/SusD family nutrient uptake outer membrane protein [Saprospiraceae bacterium]